MTKLSFITILFTFLISSLIAQTYINPPVGQVDNARMKITKIEITKKYTIAHFEYKAVYEGTISIMPTSYI